MSSKVKIQSIKQLNCNTLIYLNLNVFKVQVEFLIHLSTIVTIIL